MIRTLWHAFEVANIEKEATLENVLNAKAEVLRFKNKLRQVQMQAQQDVLMILALELTKSNFTGMKIWLDKSIAENEEYQFNSLPSKIGFSRLFAT
jgi:predicted cation transporter